MQEGDPPLPPRRFLRLLVRCASRRLPSFSPSELESLVTSLSKLKPTHFRPPPAFLARVCSLVEPHLDSYRRVVFFRLFHSLASMHHRPAWLDHFDRRVQVLMEAEGQQLGEMHISQYLQACSWLQHRPDAYLLELIFRKYRPLLRRRVSQGDHRQSETVGQPNATSLLLPVSAPCRAGSGDGCPCVRSAGRPWREPEQAGGGAGQAEALAGRCRSGWRRPGPACAA